MKNLFKLVLAGTMALSLAACSGGSGNSGGGGSAAPAESGDSELVKAAKAEGELVVYGSWKKNIWLQQLNTSKNFTASKYSIRDCPQVKFSPRSKKKTAIRPVTSGSAEPPIRTTSPQRKVFSKLMKQRMLHIS